MSMLNLGLLRHTLKLLLLKNYYEICVPKKLIKWVYQNYLLITFHRIILLPYIVYP